MLAKRIAVGALWLVGARLATKSLDLIAMLVIARILVPADFGLFALAATVLLVTEAVTDFSLANAIVQMREPPDDVYDTAFTLNTARGLVLSGVLLSVAWPFATLYDDARLAPIITVLAAVPILRGLASPRMAFLQRQLQFRPAFQLEAAGKVGAFVASVVAALLTRSYWAFVAGMIAAPAVSALLSYWLAPYRPKFGLSHWRPIFAFSGWLTLSNAINTLNWQADRLFIGGQFGNDTLGQYTVGSELASLPTNAPVHPLMQALYVGFSKLSGDRERLQGAYLISQSGVLGIALPIGILVSIFAYPIVEVTVGASWSTTAFVLQALTPILALQMVTGPAQAIAMVTGNTSSIFRRDVMMFLMRITLIVVGMLLAGFPGIVYARIGSGLFIIILNLSLVRKIIGISVARQIMSPWRLYISGIATAACAYLTGREFGVLEHVELSDFLSIGAIAAASLLVFAICDLTLWWLVKPKQSLESAILATLGKARPRPGVTDAGTS